MAVTAGRPGAANLTDVAAVDVTVGIDEIVDLEARLIRYGGQERLGLAAVMSTVSRAIVSCKPRQLCRPAGRPAHIAVKHHPVVAFLITHDREPATGLFGVSARKRRTSP